MEGLLGKSANVIIPSLLQNIIIRELQSFKIQNLLFREPSISDSQFFFDTIWFPLLVKLFVF